jgi:hypothetical protein
MVQIAQFCVVLAWLRYLDLYQRVSARHLTN